MTFAELMGHSYVVAKLFESYVEKSRLQADEIAMGYRLADEEKQSHQFEDLVFTLYKQAFVGKPKWLKSTEPTKKELKYYLDEDNFVDAATMVLGRRLNGAVVPAKDGSDDFNFEIEQSEVDAALNEIVLKLDMAAKVLPEQLFAHLLLTLGICCEGLVVNKYDEVAGIFRMEVLV